MARYLPDIGSLSVSTHGQKRTSGCIHGCTDKRRCICLLNTKTLLPSYPGLSKALLRLYPGRYAKLALFSAPKPEFQQSDALGTRAFERKKGTASPMTLASRLRHLCHHVHAGSGTLRDCRPLTSFLQLAALQHSACRNECRQSLVLYRLNTRACSRDNVSSRQRIAPTASFSDIPSSVAALDEQLEWDEAEPEQQVLVLPPPSHSRVKTADFVKSSTAVSQCPPSKHPEFAVIGRSNVGKSSLINMLTGKKALAQISKTPGKL